jgi:hypothetical protein
MDPEHRPPQPRSFEPPPWEKEQFEELARQRRERERESLERAETEAAVARLAEMDRAAAQVAAAAEPGNEELAGDARQAPGSPIDEKQVSAMLIQLSAEEPPALHGARRASKVAAAAVGLFGVAVITVGAVTGAMSIGKEALAGVGAAIVAFIGMVILGLAVWLWVRAERG